MPDPAPGLAEYVRIRRLRAGLTQEALAERAGLTVDTVGALERGLRRRLYPHTARAIADALAFAESEVAEFAELAHGRPRAPAPEAAPPPPSAESLAAPAPDAVAPRHNLPAPLTALIGRERELGRVQERLMHARLVTLTGTGGIGKSRLAIEVARALHARYPGGAWFVELAPITDAALVLGAIAATVGVREATAQPLIVTLTAALQARELLLVLDNVEQVLGAAPDIAALLRECPALTVLATSRAPLRIAGEQEFLLTPLALPAGPQDHGIDALSQFAAVQLFVERATAVKADFALTPENAPEVAEICARLDGLPLALELAAARVKLFPPHALLGRLDQRLGFLTGGPVDRTARQRTLRGAIAWSHDLLTLPERELFRRLGVFAGGFTVPTLEAIWAGDADPDAVIDTLSALIDHSLLQQDDVSPEPRFTMFETIREFALDELEASGESATWHERHAAHYLRLIETAEPDLQETTPIATVLPTRRRVQDEMGNLRAALAWTITNARAEDALRLTGALCALWVPAGNIRVARRWLDQSAGTLQEARSWLEQALALDAPAPDSARAKAHYGLGRVLLFQYEDPTAETNAAIREFERALDLYRTLGDREGVARSLLEIAAGRFDQVDLPRASALYEEALALYRELNMPSGLGWALVGLGRVAQAQDDSEHAIALFDQAIESQRAAGNPLGIAGALDGLGLARQSRHDYRGALAAFEEAVAVRRDVGAQSGLPVALQRLAVILGVAGETGRAAELMRESLSISQEMGNPWDIAAGLLTFGALASGMGLTERGVRLFAAGEALIEARGLVVPADYRALYTRSVTAARRALGEPTFATAWAAGHTLTPAAAIAEALALGGG